MGLFCKKTPVILDTNMLLLPGSQGIDIITEIKNIMNEPIQIQVTQATKFELKQIIEKKGKSKDGFNAKLGYIMIEQQGLKVISGSLGDGYADQVITGLVKPGTVVATLDKALQKELQEVGARIITIKNKRLSLV